MFRTALRNVLAHKARLLMTVLAVMLGVAFVSGTLVFTSTISARLPEESAKSFNHVDVAVQPRHSDSEDDPTAAPPPASSQTTLDKIARAARRRAPPPAVVDGFAALADKDGKLVGDGWSNPRRQLLPRPRTARTPRYPMHDGRAPHGGRRDRARRQDRRAHRLPRSATPSGSPSTARCAGDTLTGIFTTDDGNVAAGGTLVLFDTATAQQLFPKPGTYDEITVAGRARAPRQTAAARRRSSRSCREDTEASHRHSSSPTTRPRDRAAHEPACRPALLAFAGIALFVGIFIIANTFTMLVAQRTKELALLRAVGASRRQVTRSVLLEALVVGIVAAVAGLRRRASASPPACAPLDGRLRGDDARTARWSIAPVTVAAALVVGVVVTVLAAWLPARRAAKIPPVAAMSSVHAAGHRASLVAAQHHRRRARRSSAPRWSCWAPRAATDGKLLDRRRRRPAADRRLRADAAAVPPADRGSHAPLLTVCRRRRQAGPAERGAQPAPHGRHRLRADDRSDADHRPDRHRRAACSRPSTRWPPTPSRPTTSSPWPTAARSRRTSSRSPGAARRASPPSPRCATRTSRIGGGTRVPRLGVNGDSIGELTDARLRQRRWSGSASGDRSSSTTDTAKEQGLEGRLHASRCTYEDGKKRRLTVGGRLRGQRDDPAASCSTTRPVTPHMPGDSRHAGDASRRRTARPTRRRTPW